MKNDAPSKAHDELLDHEEIKALENNAELKEKIADLKMSLDDSSNKNRGLFMSFLLTQIYLLVAVAGTSDFQLLMPESKLQLPIVNFSAPLFGFYILAPVFLVAFHFNVLFNLQAHSRKLFTWARYNGTRQDSLFLPAFMFNSLPGFKPGLASYSLLRVIIFSVIYFFPLATLLFIQWRFSDYHNFYIGCWHFVVIMVDIFLLAVYWRHIIDPELHDDEYESWSYLRQSSLYINFLWKSLNFLPVLAPVAGCFALSHFWEAGEKLSKWPLACGRVFGSVFILSVLLNWRRLSERSFGSNQKRLFSDVYLFSSLWRKESSVFPFLAGVFNSAKAQKKESASPWKSFYKSVSRLLKPEPANIFVLLIFVASLSNLVILRAIQDTNLQWHDRLIEKHKKYKEVIDFFVPSIKAAEENLSRISPDKDILQYRDKDGEGHWLDAYIGIGLKNRDFRLGNFYKSILYKADFSGSNLLNANFQDAKLQRSNFQDAKAAWSIFTYAKLWGAGLESADLYQADLKKADLRGAYLEKADLRGADLSNADLRAIDSCPSFQGANLESADLRGADLYDASFQGAFLGEADLRGASLESANFSGAVVERAKFYGTDIESAIFDDSFGSIDPATADHDDLRDLEDYFSNDKFRKNVYRDFEDITGYINAILELLGNFEERARDFSERSKAGLEFQKREIEKPGGEEFLEGRRKLACSDEHVALGMIKQYAAPGLWTETNFETLFGEDGKKSLEACEEIVSYMETNCPETLSDARDLPGAESELCAEAEKE